MVKIFIVALFFILLALFYQFPTNAQSPACPTQTSNPRVQNGLISTADISPSSGKFSNTAGICAVDPGRIAFAPFKIPTYDDLKSIYFTQSKANKRDLGDETNQGNLNAALSEGLDVVKVNNLTINAPFSVSRPFVVFVDGVMNIYSPITSSGADAGVVFVVRGNINIMYDSTINATVTRVDAILISEGTICTASLKDFSCNNISAQQLVVNGSLISLDPGKPPQFKRVLADNTQPAEKIVQQPKYLVILRDLFADTYQKWSEIQ